MYNAFVLFFSASPTIDEFDEVQRAKEERREIVAKYDKVNKIVCWGGGGEVWKADKGIWGWSFPWISKSYWTYIRLKKHCLPQNSDSDSELASSSEYIYIRYWGIYICYPFMRIRIFELRKRYSFVKYLVSSSLFLKLVMNQQFWFSF